MPASFDWLEVLANSPILLVLVGCSVITLGVSLERGYYFHRRRGDLVDTLAKAREKIRQGHFKEAAWICEADQHPACYVAAEALRSHQQRPEDSEERIQIALSEQKLLLERNVSILGTMAAVAPLIGLLGTVWGIMRAFHDMALTGSAAPAVVAAGVAEALVTTAGGLIIAVPSVLLFNHFTRRTGVLLVEAENNTRNLRTFVSDLQVTGAGDRQPEISDRPRVAKPDTILDNASEILIKNL